MVGVATVVALLGMSVGSSAAPNATPQDYPNCGSYWNRNLPPSAHQNRVNSCIVGRARDGEQARAIAVYTTIEGAPIVSYVFVRGEADVLVVIDSSRDTFGGRPVWRRIVCRELRASGGYLRWTQCRTVGKRPPKWLERYEFPRA